VVGCDFSNQADDGVSRQCKLILPGSAKEPADTNEHHRRPLCSLADHDVGGLNNGGSAVPNLQAKFIHSLVRDG
jgi:hypothetical protein